MGTRNNRRNKNRRTLRKSMHSQVQRLSQSPSLLISRLSANFIVYSSDLKSVKCNVHVSERVRKAHNDYIF